MLKPRFRGHPVADADLGDGFPTRQDYALVFVGWEFDVSRQGGAIGMDMPAAQSASGIGRGGKPD